MLLFYPYRGPASAENVFIRSTDRLSWQQIRSVIHTCDVYNDQEKYCADDLSKTICGTVINQKFQQIVQQNERKTAHKCCMDP